MKFRLGYCFLIAVLGFHVGCPSNPRGQTPVGSADPKDADRDGIADGGKPVDEVTKKAPSSPTGSVHMHVYDAATGSPLKDQEVEIYVSKVAYDKDGKALTDKTIKAKTDDKGFVALDYIPFGSFAWSIKNDAYLTAQGSGEVTNNSGAVLDTPTDNSVTYIGRLYLLNKTKELTVTVPMGGTLEKDKTTGSVPSSVVAKKVGVQLQMPTYLIARSAHITPQKLPDPAAKDVTLPQAGGLDIRTAETNESGVARFAGLPNLAASVAVDPNSYKVRLTVSPKDLYVQAAPEEFDSTTLIARNFALVLTPMRLSITEVKDLTVEYSNLILAQAGISKPVDALKKDGAIQIRFNQPLATSRGTDASSNPGGCDDKDMPIGQFAVLNDYPHQIGDGDTDFKYDNSTLLFADEDLSLTSAASFSYENYATPKTTNLALSLDPSCRILTIKPTTGWPEEGASYFVYGAFTSAYKNVGGINPVYKFGGYETTQGFYVEQPQALDKTTAQFQLLRKYTTDDSADINNVYDKVLLKLNQPIKALGGADYLYACVDSAAYSGAAVKPRFADGTIDYSKPFENKSTHEVYSNLADGTVKKEILLDFGECPKEDYKLKESDMGQFIKIAKKQSAATQLTSGSSRYFQFKFGGQPKYNDYVDVYAYKANPAGDGCEADFASSYSYPEFNPNLDSAGMPWPIGVLPSASATIPSNESEGKILMILGYNNAGVFTSLENVPTISTIGMNSLVNCRKADGTLLVNKKLPINSDFSFKRQKKEYVNPNLNWNLDLDRRYLFKGTETTKNYIAGSKLLKMKIYINPIVDGKPYTLHQVVDLNGNPLPPSIISVDINADTAKRNRPVTVNKGSELRKEDAAEPSMFLHN